MYQIISSDGSVLYDVNYPDTYMVTEPKATLEIGQPGSLQFSLVPEHPKYSQVEVMKTYVTATKEGSEIFYGRIIDINVDQTTGVKEIECAGALQFLEDGEIPPVQNQNAGEGEDKGVTMTASAFFTMCINAFNSDIGNDPKRNLYVGTISHSKASETKVYNIGSYTQVKSALDSNIISEYGGYFKIRKSGNAHYVDWLESYSEPNSSPIRLTENVVSQQNAISANEFFTLIRPIGKDSLTLPEVTIPVSSALVSEYGRIIRTEQFGDAETESDLRSKANQYISRIGKGLGRTCTVKVVDMHFLKNTVAAIHLGSTYTNISGFEGEEMVVAGMELNFANPAEDSVTLKNSKELCQIQMGGSTGRGTLSQASRAGSGSGKGGFQNIWEHITETEDTLSLHAKEISINAEHLVETATEFERYSRRTDDAINKIEGTGVFQNNDRITQIAGSFSTRYFVVPQAKRDAPGANPSAYHWYVCTPDEVHEEDIGSGKEFFQTPTAALRGEALNTAALTVGQSVYYMHYTDDITPDPSVVYYTKGLALNGGTELTLTEDGQEVTVASAILSNQDDIVTIEGSALWTQRNNITGVVGEFEIRTDPVTGERRVVVKSGGGIKIERNQTEFGLYETDDSNNSKLTAGVIVGKINDPNNTDKVLGTKVDIVASQVRVGSTSNVEAWMGTTDTWKNSTDETLDTYQGLIADRATIAQLNAQKARIDNLEADAITADWLAANDITTGDIRADDLNVNNIICADFETSGVVDAGSVYAGALSINQSAYFTDCIINATVNSSTNTLTLTKASGGTVTFSKPAPVITLSPSWSGNTYTVTVYKDGAATSISESVDVYARLHSNGGNHMDVAAATYSGGVFTDRGSATDLYIVQNGSGSSATAQIRTANSASSGTAYASLDIGSLYTSGRNSVSISSIEVYGSPAASATSITVKATASNGATSTEGISISTQRTDAYKAGWDAACDKISRTDNKIYGPKKGGAADGSTELKFTAIFNAATYTASSYTASKYTKETYKASGYSYTPSQYTAARHSYTASTDSYKASGHSHTNPSLKLAGVTVATTSGYDKTYTAGSPFVGRLVYSPGSDSYSASQHSYTASSHSYSPASYTAESVTYSASQYTASSYTKESYTPSTFTQGSISWS